MIPAAPESALAPSFIAKTNAFQIFGDSPELVLGTVDSYGVYWWWEDIDGWFSSAPFTPVVEPLGNSDYGTWAERFARTPKTYTIKGYYYAGSVTAAWAARERLMTYWGDPNTIFDMIVNEPTEPKRATVRLNGPVSSPWTGSVGIAKGFTFEIPLIAKDPLKYAISPMSASVGTQSPGLYGFGLPLTLPLSFTPTGDETAQYATLVNVGNEKSAPVTTLSGAIPAGWRITNLDDGNKTLWISRGLNAGDVLTLDHKTSLARINGVSIDVGVYGDWFSLVPGQNRVQLSSPAATDATLTVTGYSAWR